MKKRHICKRNKYFIKKNILSIVSKVFKIKDKRYGNGYFIFTFAGNSICHFHLEELPHWKFGIWLSEDKTKKKTYQIFGQIEVLIDKFKPYASNLCFSDVKKFNTAFKSIHLKGGFSEPYEKELYDNEIESIKKADVVNKENYEIVKKAVDAFNQENKKIANVKIVDGNTKHWRTSPRYSFQFFTDDKVGNDVLIEALKPLVKTLDEVDKKYTMDNCDFYFKVEQYEWEILNCKKWVDYDE